jgi:alkylhydroperoxidase family enzyme
MADDDNWRGLDRARIEPADPADVALPLWPAFAIARRVVRGETPRILTTLAKHGRLFAAWGLYGSQLMPRGKLARADTELVILRVAWNMGSMYEWNHHVHIGRRAGLSDDDIQRVKNGPGADGWTDHQRALLRAADEMHADGIVSDETWAALAGRLDEPRLIELCLLIGQYEGLAMAIASLGIQPESAEPAA